MQIQSERSATASLVVLLVILGGAPFLASLDLFVVNVAFEKIGAGFPGHSLADLSWILNGYAIIYAALLVPLGRWSDKIGRRRGFVVGLFLFTAASAAAAASPNLWLLVIFRLIQAVGAAALTPASLGLLIAAVPIARRAASVRIWAALGASAAALGPVVGGLLVELSWRWVFIINIPIGIALIAMTFRFIPDAKAPATTEKLDFLGAFALTIGIGALALAVVEGPSWGWSSVRIVTAFVVAAAALLGFFFNNSRNASPLIDPALLRITSFAFANLAGFLFSAAFAAGLLANILWLQQVWGYSALTAGLAIAPGPVLVPIFALISQRISRRVGAGTIAALGCALLGVGSILVIMSVGQDPAYASDFLPGWLIGGAGVGFALPTILSTATSELPEASSSTGSAIVNMSRQIGTVIGISILIAVLGATTASQGFDAVLHSFQTAWWIIASIAFVSAAASFGLGGTTR